MSCSPAELISVSFEQSKFQFNQLYLQTVEKGNHLPYSLYEIYSDPIYNGFAPTVFTIILMLIHLGILLISLFVKTIFNGKKINGV
jgi:ABC-type phosphate transport system permease subunit